jgi:hypothetical protein
MLSKVKVFNGAVEKMALLGSLGKIFVRFLEKVRRALAQCQKQ